MTTSKVCPIRPKPLSIQKCFVEDAEEEDVNPDVDLRVKLQNTNKIYTPVITTEDDNVLQICADGSISESESESENVLLNTSAVSSWAEEMDEISADEDDNFQDASMDQIQSGCSESSQIEDDDDQNASTSAVNDNLVGLRRSNRTNKGHLPKKYANAALEIQEKLNELTLQDRQPIEPATYSEAMSSWDKLEWKEAIDQEINSQLANETWELVPRPVKRKVLKNMWGFKLKKRPEGWIKYKARLVVKGCTQVPGIDYGETFSPVIRYETVRLLIATGAGRGYKFMVFDITSAFLNTSLEEDVYMEQPQGCKVVGGYVCMLYSSIYSSTFGIHPNLCHPRLRTLT